MGIQKMSKRIRAFSEGISTGSKQVLRITKSFQETKTKHESELTPFERQSREVIKQLALRHPQGFNAFIRGLNKGLKYGYRPVELEILFRTWLGNKGIIGNVRQQKLLAYVWPSLKNKISEVGPPYKGGTVYDKQMAAHRKGLTKETYAEKVNARRLQTEMNYHSAVGYY